MANCFGNMRLGPGTPRAGQLFFTRMAQQEVVLLPCSPILMLLVYCCICSVFTITMVVAIMITVTISMTIIVDIDVTVTVTRNSYNSTSIIL